MSINITYPTAAVMDRIMPDLVNRDRAERLGLKIFPMEQKSTFFVRWIQEDNSYGIMAFRGLDGQPSRVKRIGEATYVYEPGVYGEFTTIDERELLTRTSAINPTTPVPIDDLVQRDNRLLVERTNNRMEANIWNLLATGTLTIPLNGPNGPAVYTDTYGIQTYTAPIPWATASTAVPIQDLQFVQQLSVGHGADLGAGAKAYMNRFTANLLLNNANTADFAGKRNQFGATLNDTTAFNNYFQNQGLPEIVVYDKGYQNQSLVGPIANASTQFVKYITNHKVLIVGSRPNGAPVGTFQQTLQAGNPAVPASPGEYYYIKDYARGINAPVETPARVEIHHGFNGGPTLLYPSAIVSMTV